LQFPYFFVSFGFSFVPFVAPKSPQGSAGRAQPEVWTPKWNPSTFSYGNHISTSITKARSTGNIRERAFAF
jgi:hypothetical protein